MYATARGVPQDDAEAVRWFRLAAEQGHDSAQSRLGLKYATGEGVPQDYVSAHMWLNLAAAAGVARGGVGASKVREMVADAGAWSSFQRRPDDEFETDRLLWPRGGTHERWHSITATPEAERPTRANLAARLYCFVKLIVPERTPEQLNDA